MLFEYRKVFLKTVCDKIFQIMIAIENRRELDKRYKFENINEVFLKKKQSDSSRFIEYCELNTNDSQISSAQSNDDSQKSTKVSMKKR